ncbi:MAG: hypothetical protein RR322_06425 [Oscillospiraceae bacterium]
MSKVCDYYESCGDCEQGFAINCKYAGKIVLDNMLSYKKQIEFCSNKEQCEQCEYNPNFIPSGQIGFSNMAINDEDIIEVKEDDLHPVLTENADISGYEVAFNLHNEILIKKQIAGQALFELGKSLINMKNSKLYLKLGYDNFDDYCVEAVGFKQRQSYAYISVCENFSKEFLQSNASIGITKLVSLSKVPFFDREEFLKENPPLEMNVKEFEDAVERAAIAEEQCSLLSTQVETLKVANNELQADFEKIDNMKDETTEEKEKMQTELKKINAELEKAKADAEKLRELNADEIAKIRAKAVAEATENVKEQMGEDYRLLQKQFEVEEEKRKRLEQELKLADDKDMVKFKYMVESLQGDFNKINTFINSLSSEEQQKYKGAMRKLCNNILANI